MIRPISDAARPRPVELLLGPSFLSAPRDSLRSDPGGPDRWGGGSTAAAAAAEAEEGAGEGEMRKAISICTRLRGMEMRPRRSRCASPALSPSTQGTAFPAPRKHHHPCQYPLPLLPPPTI